MTPRINRLLGLAATTLSATLHAQQPASVPLGPNQLHTTTAKPAATAPAPLGQKDIRRQASRINTRQTLQQKHLRQQRRVATYLASLTPVQRASEPAGSKLIDVRGGRLLYHIDHNENAAITSTTSLVRNSSNYSNVDGSGINIGVWEVNVGSRNGHPEWNNRYTYLDGRNTSSLHAAHVIGTIAATGTDPAPRIAHPRL